MNEKNCTVRDAALEYSIGSLVNMLAFTCLNLDTKTSVFEVATEPCIGCCTIVGQFAQNNLAIY